MQMNGSWDIACLGFLATPAFIFAVCIALGPLVALAEGWRVHQGIEYLLANTMGLEQPLINIEPCTALGTCLGVAASALGILAFHQLFHLLEGWHLVDGYKFAVSEICQFPNPITDVLPDTAWGGFVEVLCIALQVLVQSIALDTISSHPLTSKFIQRLQDKGVRRRAGQICDNEEDRSAWEDVGVTEGAWKQRVLELEDKLKE
eukprot:5425605-Amphidinium_carterae.1